MSEAAARLADQFGGYWHENSAFPVSDWQYEVANGDTRQSYWDWVIGKMEEQVTGRPPR